MSFNTLRPYFQDRMQAVDSELNEWEDAFNDENIPSSILDKSWHVRFGAFDYRGTAHTCLTFNCPVTLKVYFKGYRNPVEAVDTAMNFADSIVRECTKPTQRLNQPKIKNVLPNLIDIRELGQTNDNIVILEIQFNCEVIID